MDISRRCDYAIRMLLALASDGDDCPTSVRELAERQGVPYAFARAVQRDLSAAGLVTAHRGSHGGVCLARPADEISLLDVISAVQGEPTVAACSADDGACERGHACGVRDVWREADRMLLEYLGAQTLGGLTPAAGG